MRSSKNRKKLETGYVQESTNNLDQALGRIQEACQLGLARSVALLGNAAEILPELLKRGIRPDAITDQTSAHDPLNGYLPIGYSLEKAKKMRESQPQQIIHDAKKSMAVHVQAMLAYLAQGIPVFDYGNNIRQMAYEAGVENAFDIPGFVPEYIRPLFCKGIGPFRWVHFRAIRRISLKPMKN